MQDDAQIDEFDFTGFRSTPSGNLCWLDPVSGALIVGAKGSFGLTSGEVNTLIAAYLGSVSSIVASAGTGISIGTPDAQLLYFKTNNVNRWYVDASGHLRTWSGNSYDIGTSSSSPRR